MHQRMRFWDLFRANPDGSLQPTRVVKIGGVQMDPGVKFTRGVAFSGFDLFQYYGRDLEVEIQDGVAVITGIF